MNPASYLLSNCSIFANFCSDPSSIRKLNLSKKDEKWCGRGFEFIIADGSGTEEQY